MHRTTLNVTGLAWHHFDSSWQSRRHIEGHYPSAFVMRPTLDLTACPPRHLDVGYQFQSFPFSPPKYILGASIRDGRTQGQWG